MTPLHASQKRAAHDEDAVWMEKLLRHGPIPQRAQFFDHNQHLFIRFEPALGRAPQPYSLGGAGADHIASFERSCAGDVFDQSWNLED